MANHRDIASLSTEGLPVARGARPSFCEGVAGLGVGWVACPTKWGAGKVLPVGEVAFERYRRPSLIGQRGMGKVSPHRVTQIIERLACAQDGAGPQGFAKNSKNFPSRPPQPACESVTRAATTGR